ncbi:MAG: WXG100 family type VII secretion target, partial [Meiothermus sp.]|nr:WXG100 family type VII secretion target [Meiothermus sp.]
MAPKPAKYNPDGSPYLGAMEKFGRTTPRCQGTTKNGLRAGWQCAQPARKGYSVCRVHGAGTRKRVKEGVRKDPKTTGARAARLYMASEYSLISELAREIEALELDLDNTDSDFAHLRAVIKQMLAAEGQVEDSLRRMKDGCDAIELILEGTGGRPSLEAALKLGQSIRAIHRALVSMSRYLKELSDHLLQVSVFAKSRAEIRAKTARPRMIREFLTYVGWTNLILQDVLPLEEYEAIYERTRREVIQKLMLSYTPVSPDREHPSPCHPAQGRGRAVHRRQPPR